MAGTGSGSSSCGGGRAFPSLLLANVQSLAGKAEDLKSRLEDRDVDVCAVTEARISDASKAEMEGFSLWLQTPQREKSRLEVALYVREDITSTVLPIQVPEDLDVLWVRTGLRSYLADVSCMVFCVVHHTQPHTSRLTEVLVSHLKEVISGIYSGEPDTGVVVLGVFNNFPEHKIPPELNLQQVVNKPTHRGSNTEIIVTNLASYYKKPRLLRPIASSTHKSVYWVPK